MTWPKDFARKVWRILVEECDAPSGQKIDLGDHQVDLDEYSFVLAATSEPTDYSRGGISEYRFCGSLGFGGKVWRGPPPYVTCYREDETPAIKARMEKANRRLTALWVEAKLG